MGIFTSKQWEDMLETTKHPSTDIKKRVGTPPLPHKNRIVLFDPRLPTCEISRTPLQTHKTQSQSTDTPPDRLKLEFDPRSPSLGVIRTPIYIDVSPTPNRKNDHLHDPRSPSTVVQRTPLDELKNQQRHLYLNTAGSSKLVDSILEDKGRDSELACTPKILFTEAEEKSYEEEEVKKQPKRTPLKVLNSPGQWDCPREMLQARQMKDISVKKTMDTRNMKHMLSKQNKEDIPPSLYLDKERSVLHYSEDANETFYI